MANSTKLSIESAKREFDGLVLEVDPNQADKFLETFKPGEYEISPYKEKRSLNANSYCWVLCNKIAQKLQAQKLQVSDVDIYRDAILESGYWQEMRLKPEDVEGFTKRWKQNGLGWQTEQVDYDQDGDTVVMFAYFGSSTYNTAEMSRLINWLVQEAEQLGIETEDPEKVRQMLEYWEREFQKNHV